MSGGLRMTRSRVPLVGVIGSGSLTILANGVGAIAYPWLVYDLSGSVAWMGLVATLALAPLVIGTLFGSVLIDRYGARRIAILGDTLGALAAIAIAVLASFGLLSVELLAALAFLSALLDGPAIIAHESRLPEIARLARLPLARVNIIDDLLDNTASIAAPALAGVFVTIFSAGSTLYAIAGIATIGALLTAFTMPHFKPRSGPLGPALAAALEGPRFIARAPTLRHALLLATFGMAAFIAIESVILPAILRGADRPASDLGLFLSAVGIAAVAINVALAMLKRAPALRSVFVAALAGLAASIGLLAIDQSVPALIGAGALLGFSAGPLTPIFNTLLQTASPKAIRARVIGASSGLVLAAAPLATLASGFGLEVFGALPLLIAAAALSGLLALLALRLPGRPEPASRARLPKLETGEAPQPR